MPDGVQCPRCTGGAVVRTAEKGRTRFTCTSCGRVWFVADRAEPEQAEAWWAF